MTEEHRNRLIEAGFVFIEQSNEYRVPVQPGVHVHMTEEYILDLIDKDDFDGMLFELVGYEGITER